MPCRMHSKQGMDGLFLIDQSTQEKTIPNTYMHHWSGPKT